MLQRALASKDSQQRHFAALGAASLLNKWPAGKACFATQPIADCRPSTAVTVQSVQSVSWSSVPSLPACLPATFDISSYCGALQQSCQPQTGIS